MSAVAGAAADADAVNGRHRQLLDALPLVSFDGLPEDMLCVVCQQPSLDNVSCCAAGHNACRPCADRLTNGRCPMSCGPLVRHNGGWLRNTPLNSYIREANLNCPHTEGGCTHKCKIRDMRAHMDACAYRTITCPCGGEALGAARTVSHHVCDWSGPANQLAQHLKDVDHSGYVVNMLHQNARDIEELSVNRVNELKDRFVGVEQWQTAFAERERKRDEQLAEFKRTLDVVKDHTDKRDGSAKRSVARHKAMAQEIKSLKTELATEKEKAARVEELEAERDARVARCCELEEEQHSTATIATAQKDELRGQRDQAMKQRDEAVAEAARWTQVAKRRRETNVDSERHYKRANKQLHELHAVLARMVPHAAARSCPCADCQFDRQEEEERVE